MSANQPQANYRVSIKALIRDDQGRLLLVREADDPWWGLPGGGMDHVETIDRGLKRELLEEVGAEVTSYDPRPAFAWTFYADERARNAELLEAGYRVWLVYRVKLAGPPRPPKDQIKWVAPAEFKKEDFAPYFDHEAFLALLS